MMNPHFSSMKSIYGSMVQPLRLDFESPNPAILLGGGGSASSSLFPAAAPKPAPSFYTHETVCTHPSAPHEMQQPPLPRDNAHEVAATVDLWKRKLAHESHNLTKIEAEAVRLNTEESLLKSRLQDISAQHRNLDNQLLQIQQGWADLYQRECEGNEEIQSNDRLRALVEDTSKVEERVSIVRDRHADVKKKHSLVMQQLASLSFVVEQTRRQEEAASELESTVAHLDQRRRRALAVCTKMFDLECCREKDVMAGLEKLGHSNVSSSGPVSTGRSVDSSIFDPVANHSVLMSVRANNFKRRRTENPGSVSFVDSSGLSGKSIVLPVR